MDRLSALEIFIRVVETGSFTAVAKERGTTQSAVSKAVAGLEDQLNVKLLTRTTRTLTLTDNGQIYFEKLRHILGEMTEADASLKAGETLLRGRLKVASSVGFGRIVLLPVIDQFLSEHPGVSIDLNLSDGFIDLIEQGIDVSVRLGALSDSSLIARSIGKSQRALMASSLYADRHPHTPLPIQHPHDLKAHNCLVYTGQAHPHDWEFISPDGSTMSVRVSGTLQTNSSEVIRAACLAGMGISYAPLWLFQQEIQSGAVQILLPEWPKIEMGIHAVVPPHRRNLGKVKSFIDFLSARLHNES